MGNFKNWFENQTAIDVTNAFNAMGAAAHHGANEKQKEYAARIAKGEDPTVVMQGIQPNGPMWNLVMQKVAQLKGGSGQVKLSDMAGKITDPNWHQLYDRFAKYQPQHPNDPQVQQLGQALHQSAQSGNMSVLSPFVQKHLKAQPLQ